MIDDKRIEREIKAQEATTTGSMYFDRIRQRFVFVGKILCVVLSNGIRLYCPRTSPDKTYTLEYDVVITCDAHGCSTDDVEFVEPLEGVIETIWLTAGPGDREWTLVDLYLANFKWPGQSIDRNHIFGVRNQPPKSPPR